MRELVVYLIFATANAAVAEDVVNNIVAEVKNVVPRRDLSQAERHFLSTVPERDSAGTAGFRKAVEEMLLAGVVHVPPCGQFIPAWEKDYWRMYQVWTAKKTVQVPVVQGPRGPQGPPGPPGELKLLLPEKERPEERLILQERSGPQAGRSYEYEFSAWEKFWGTIRDTIPIFAAKEVRPTRVEVNQIGGGAQIGNVTAQGGTASSSSNSSSSSSSSSSAAAAASAN